MADEKFEAVTVHVPASDAVWLRETAAKHQRSVSFVARQAIQRSRLVETTGCAFDSDPVPADAA